MVHLSRSLMDFPLPLPASCRGSGKRKWEVAVTRGAGRGVWRDVGAWGSARRDARPIRPAHRSASGEAVSVGGFDDEAGGGHSGEAFVESGGADAAGCAQLGEWPRFIPLGESRGDTLIDGSRLGTAIRLVIWRLDGLEGEGVVALGQFQSDTGHRGGGAVFDGQDDAILTVAAEIEVGIAPGVEFG